MTHTTGHLFGIRDAEKEIFLMQKGNNKRQYADIAPTLIKINGCCWMGDSPYEYELAEQHIITNKKRLLKINCHCRQAVRHSNASFILAT